MSPTEVEMVDTSHVGPHPSHIQVSRSYVTQEKLQKYMAATGVSESREESLRLQGIAYIDSTRKALQLPVRTYNTAAVYYHRFRLVHADNEYNYVDAAAAALFTACKVEDTLKKSKEILCAAYNLKLTSAEKVTQDDPIFDMPSKSILGLERLMLEASAFDFRSHYPQKLLIKIAKYYRVEQHTVAKTAYYMCLDIYRTFAPLKQTATTMVMACVELSGRLYEQNVLDLESGKDYDKWKINRPAIMETLLDMLDLYTHHRVSTIVGQQHPIESFISIRIILNQEATANKLRRYTSCSKHFHPAANGTKGTNGVGEALATRDSARHVSRSNKPSPVSPKGSKADNKAAPAASGVDPVSPLATTGRQQRIGLREGTVRFMLDGDTAKEEKRVVDEYFIQEEEEYEVEVEVEVAKPRERRR